MTPGQLWDCMVGLIQRCSLISKDLPLQFIVLVIPITRPPGAMQLEPAPNHMELSQLLMEACQQAGAPLSEDFNGVSQLGVGRLDAKAFKGIRQSAAEAYLRPLPDNVYRAKHIAGFLGIEFDGVRARGLKLPEGCSTWPERKLFSVLALSSHHKC